MSQNYDFLRTFTFDGKETNHLFQIAKVNIPFMSKENDFYSVGNTDARHFRNTKLGEHSISIDGFVIKDNTGKSVSDSLDELKMILNSDEPKQLIFDIFPERYFNAIFSGVQEYDATNLDYTPLTLVFDVPDALSHAIHTKSYSNVYTTGTNLVLDSEYKNPKKYMAQWARVLENKHDNSAVIQGDLSEGLPYGYKPVDQYYWVNNTEYTRRNIQKLPQGQGVSFSIEAEVLTSDADPNITKAGMMRAELWQSNPLKLVKYVDINIPKTATGWNKYGVTIETNTDTIDMINLAYCLNGKAKINYSKPMMALLPPIAAIVKEPIAGATLYSNSLEWGDYDYSGNPNLMNNLSFSDFAVQAGGGTISDGGSFLKINKTSGTNLFVMAGYKNSAYYLTPVLSNTTYTITYTIRKSSNFVPQSGKRIVARYGLNQNVTTSNLGELVLDSTSLTEEFTTYTKTFTTGALVNPNSYYFQVLVEEGLSGEIELSYEIKLERGSVATPYQPNILEAPWQVSKYPINSNLANKDITFPYTTALGIVYNSTNITNWVANKPYVLRIKASPINTVGFDVFLGKYSGTNYVGRMKPVEGLAKTYELRFTPTIDKIDTTHPRGLIISQEPSASPLSITIEWLKIEEGANATPPIDYYKYRGLGTFPSNNPYDYSWTYDPNYYKAINYVPSEEGMSDVVAIKNNGTYRTHPKFSFTMNGENGLVGLIHQNGSVLQFGNPEDVDGTTPTRQEFGLRENLYGSTLNPNIKVNKDFKSVYPNMNSNPATPNLFQGSWNMTDDIDSATPQFATAPAQEVWHGPSMVLPIQAPSDNNRAGHFRTHVRFNFDNRSKRARGRTEVSVMDTSGNYVMGAVIRDSDSTSDSFVFEAWYKDTMVKSQTITKKVFNKTFFELVIYRTGKELLWKLTQVKSLNANNTVNDDKVIWVSWNLDEPETSNINTVGVWQMRHQNNQHVLMSVTDIQARWSATSYYQDIKNQFQDGDIVEVDVASRSLFINGSVNNTLNVVGNEWETFVCEPGETIVQPVYSSWANIPEVTGELREVFL